MTATTPPVRSNRPMAKFTPTEVKILAVLSDGMPHTREELHGCLMDELGDLSNVKVHITYLRRKLRPMGQDIVYYCHTRREMRYRHVRLLNTLE